MCKFNYYAITLDIEWASDEIIAQVASLFIKYKVKATWFVTHNSKAIQELKNYPNLFELGLHPNFSENSTQGKNPLKVMENLLKIVPNAKSVRSHSLMQSSRLFTMMIEKFNILYDVSLFLPGTHYLVPHKIFFSKTASLLRFPYFWEDDLELYKPKPVFDISYSCYHRPGLKIFNFHPILVILNSQNLDNYERIKTELDYSKASLKDLGHYISKGRGVGDFFQEILEFIGNKKLVSYTIADLAIEFRNLL